MKQIGHTFIFVFFLQTGGFGHQLEIVLVTCQSGTSIQKQVEATSLDLEQLKVSTTYIMLLIFTRYFSCFGRARVQQGSHWLEKYLKIQDCLESP